MDEKVVIGTLDTEVEKISKGYELLDEKFICCGNCKRKLIEVIKVKNSNEKNTLVAECPFCDDSSFKVDFIGKIYIAPVDECAIGDIQMDIKPDRMISKIKVVKSERRV